MILPPIYWIQRMIVDIPICIRSIVVFFQFSKRIEVIDLVCLKYIPNPIFKT